jgi:hypothetical protein
MSRSFRFQFIKVVNTAPNHESGQTTGWLRSRQN